MAFDKVLAVTLSNATRTRERNYYTHFTSVTDNSEPQYVVLFRFFCKEKPQHLVMLGFFGLLLDVGVSAVR